jgi:Zn-dependent protease/CBS domain-containing protein
MDHAKRSAAPFIMLVPPASAPARGVQPATERPGRWSLRLGRIAGIAIDVHASFFLLLGWVAVGRLRRGEGGAAALESSLLVLAVFASVVLHELGHALTARRFGIRTRNITLLPIGGLARLERMPEKPAQEMLVAAAGPAVNFVIALLLAAGLWLASSDLSPEVASARGPFLAKLMWINVTLGLFNLLPAFPMDGGRVLRAGLALRLGRAPATLLSTRIGKIMAGGLAMLGVLYDPMLLLIGGFVWLGAHQEASVVQAKSALAGLTAADAMFTDLQALEPGETLASAAVLLAHATARDFLVADRHRVVGVIGRDEIVQAIAAGGSERRVEDVMHADFEVALASTSLSELFERMGTATRPMLVVDGGEVAGLLTASSLVHAVRMTDAFLRGRAAHA